MKGFGLNKNLDGAEFLGVFHTEPSYRIFSINDVHPGMFKVTTGGVSVEGEMYTMSDEIWARVEAGEPPHLYSGPVKLTNGQTVEGILFPEDKILPSHVEITKFGGWRAYMASKAK